MIMNNKYSIDFWGKVVYLPFKTWLALCIFLVITIILLFWWCAVGLLQYSGWLFTYGLITMTSFQSSIKFKNGESIQKTYRLIPITALHYFNTLVLLTIGIYNYWS